MCVLCASLGDGGGEEEGRGEIGRGGDREGGRLQQMLVYRGSSVSPSAVAFDKNATGGPELEMGRRGWGMGGREGDTESGIGWSSAGQWGCN